MFFNFLKFFATVLEFPIPSWVGMNRNDNFFFSHSEPLPSHFGLKGSHNDVFFNVLNFFAIFLEFPIPDRVGMDQNGNFLFSHSQPLPSRFGLKRSHNDVFKFFESFCYISRIP